MNSCRHVQKVRPSSNNSVLNPQNWKCFTCQATENVWACLSCGDVYCGKFLNEHIKEHSTSLSHPLCMSIHEKYIYCYACDDYVLNDNAAGDIKILRNCLQAISPFNNSIKKEPSEESSFEKNKDSLKHNSIDSSLQLSPDLTPIDSNDNSKSTSANRRRSSRVQKCNSNSIYHYKKYAYFYNNDVTSFLMEQASQSFQKISNGVGSRNDESDAHTEIWFRRYYLLSHCFKQWRQKTNYVQSESSEENEETTDNKDEEKSKEKLKITKRPSSSLSSSSSGSSSFNAPSANSSPTKSKVSAKKTSNKTNIKTSLQTTRMSATVKATASACKEPNSKLASSTVVKSAANTTKTSKNLPSSASSSSLKSAAKPSKKSLPKPFSTSSLSKNSSSSTSSRNKRKRPVGAVGLENLGNTCYMNSILQVLRHLSPFSKVFIEGNGFQKSNNSPQSVDNAQNDNKTNNENKKHESKVNNVKFNRSYSNSTENSKEHSIGDIKSNEKTNGSYTKDKTGTTDHSSTEILNKRSFKKDVETNSAVDILNDSTNLDANNIYDRVSIGDKDCASNDNDISNNGNSSKKSYNDHNSKDDVNGIDKNIINNNKGQNNDGETSKKLACNPINQSSQLNHSATRNDLTSHKISTSTRCVHNVPNTITLQQAPPPTASVSNDNCVFKCPMLPSSSSSSSFSSSSSIINKKCRDLTIHSNTHHNYKFTDNIDNDKDKENVFDNKSINHSTVVQSASDNSSQKRHADKEGNIAPQHKHNDDSVSNFDTTTKQNEINFNESKSEKSKNDNIKTNNNNTSSVDTSCSSNINIPLKRIDDSSVAGRTKERRRNKVPTKLSLSQELNSLLRIMWSGKMSMVSPHKMLHAVWNIIPFFKGYSQQDAQEFLSEFLDKVQSEMDFVKLSLLKKGLNNGKKNTINEVSKLGGAEECNGGSGVVEDCHDDGDKEKNEKNQSNDSMKNNEDENNGDNENNNHSKEEMNKEDFLSMNATTNNIQSVENSLNGNVSDDDASDTQEDLVTQLFQGELFSQVRCLTCGHESRKVEAFMDLSLEFPLRFHGRSSFRRPHKPDKSCKLEEMLSQFMQVEKLEGKIYACEQCNEGQRERVYSEIEKCFRISKLPSVLRLHLKRFMWSGKSSRGKIMVNVTFPPLLNLSPYCHHTSTNHTSNHDPSSNHLYKLSAVVVHHGRGFGSGHYTAYCWNNDADSWLHCNDAKMQKVSPSEVHQTQAYILVYTKHSLTSTLSPDLSFSSDLSSPTISPRSFYSANGSPEEHKKLSKSTLFAGAPVTVKFEPRSSNSASNVKNVSKKASRLSNGVSNGDEDMKRKVNHNSSNGSKRKNPRGDCSGDNEYNNENLDKRKKKSLTGNDKDIKIKEKFNVESTKKIKNNKNKTIFEDSDKKSIKNTKNEKIKRETKILEGVKIHSLSSVNERRDGAKTKSNDDRSSGNRTRGLIARFRDVEARNQGFNNFKRTKTTIW